MLHFLSWLTNDLDIACITLWCVCVCVFLDVGRWIGLVRFNSSLGLCDLPATQLLAFRLGTARGLGGLTLQDHITCTNLRAEYLVNKDCN